MERVRKFFKRTAYAALAAALMFIALFVYLESSKTTAEAEEEPSAYALKIAYVTDANGCMHVFNTDQTKPSADGSIKSIHNNTYKPKDNSKTYAYITSRGDLSNCDFSSIGHGKYTEDSNPDKNGYFEVKSVDIEADTTAVSDMDRAFGWLQNVKKINNSKKSASKSKKTSKKPKKSKSRNAKKPKKSTKKTDKKTKKSKKIKKSKKTVKAAKK